MRKWTGLLLSSLLIVSTGCQTNQTQFAGAANEVKLVTLDPGHFHAALVQKTMYPQVDSTVHVYAPEGPDAEGHLQRIESFNTRLDDPTRWNEVVYTGPDYLKRMLSEKKGNVVVTAGNNSKKTDYINRSILAGFNVLADKPMVITPEKFPLLVKSFQDAEWRGLLLYDIMTERHEITTILQKELSQIPEVFGQLQTGTLENPAVTKESVHHFFKYVAGNPLRRPAWYFDTNQQGEGLVDVTTHLVDLIQWECFPEQILYYKKDIQMLNAKRWPTLLTPEQFSKVTGLESYPDYLGGYVTDGQLGVYSNGEMNYTIKGVHAKVSVTWNFQAPEGTGDTHYSIMRGTRANLIIRQGAAENYKPVLYVEANDNAHIDNVLHRAVYKTLQGAYPGITMTSLQDGKWRIDIPDKYHVGHEAHFAQVTEKYLRYLKDGKLPDWEVPNMIAKYYTTTEALKAAGR
ncbi:MAG: oxidoreductase [Phycisphaerae bacterium]|nr:oxidoreductase [Phycisphaerae bacterium]